MLNWQLLSGWSMPAVAMQPLAEALQARHPQDSIECLDWPGYGNQPPLTDPNDLSQLAAIMAPRLRRNALWLGWSLGGLLLSELVNRIGPPKGLILLGQSGRFTAAEGHLGITQETLESFAQRYHAHPDRTLKYFQHWQASGEAQPRIAQQQLADDLAQSVQPDDRTLRAGLEQLATLDCRANLAQAACPVWQLCGTEDPLCLQRQATLPGGHLIHRVTPDAVAEWLDQHVRAQILP